MKRKEMNRIERIADMVGLIALFAAVGLTYLVFMQWLLFLYPAAVAAYILFYAANAVVLWRRKRVAAVVNILGAIAFLVLICFFFF